MQSPIRVTVRSGFTGSSLRTTSVPCASPSARGANRTSSGARPWGGTTAAAGEAENAAPVVETVTDRACPPGFTMESVRRDVSPRNTLPRSNGSSGAWTESRTVCSFSAQVVSSTPGLLRTATSTTPSAISAVSRSGAIENCPITSWQSSPPPPTSPSTVPSMVTCANSLASPKSPPTVTSSAAGPDTGPETWNRWTVSAWTSWNTSWEVSVMAGPSSARMGRGSSCSWSGTSAVGRDGSSDSTRSSA